MTVFPFPADAAEISAPFSVVGFDWERGTPEGELLVVPEGADAPPFDGPVWSPAAARDWPGLLRPAGAAPAGSPVWLSCACTAGTLEHRLREAAAAFGARLWLRLEPQSALYHPPCPAEAGRPVTAAELAAVRAAHPDFDCPEFVCRCCHWDDGGRLSVLLFDTEETIGKKLDLTASLDIPYVFGPFPLDR